MYSVFADKYNPYYLRSTLCVLTEGAAALGAVAGGGVGVPGSLVITTTAAVAQHALAAAVASDAAADIPHQLEVGGAS